MRDIIYKNRREELFKLLDDGVAILTSAKYKTRSNDTEFAYRQESNFYYLSGILEDECIIVFEKNSKIEKTYLFVKEIDKKESLWLGRRMGVRGAKKRYSFDEVLNTDEFDNKIEDILKNRKKLYCNLFSEDRIVKKTVLTCKSALMPKNFIDIYTIVQKMRLIKSDDEIELIKRAISITKEAHHKAMKRVTLANSESEVSAELEYIFAKNGAKYKAYENIVAAGNSANTLHYIDNDKSLKKSQLVLIDAGCEYKMYASDITRVSPVSGRFTEAQKELYEMVLRVQLKIISMIKPDITKNKLQKKSEKLLTEGMVSLGILKGDVKKLVKKKKHKRYYPHGIGHWMGIDVHDPSPYLDESLKPVKFQKGMVLTIEPGIYIDKNDKKVPKKYRGVGIRIEDNILVTEDGYENLSSDIAKTVSEIEQISQL